MNKKESRYFCTAEKMDRALVELLEKKDFEYITVSELCKVAGVNRSTFYLHYENTSELLEETVRYIIDKHLSYYNISSSDMSLDYENCKKEDLIFITAKYLAPYLAFIKDNQKLFRIAIMRFEAMDFERAYRNMFAYIFNPVLEKFNVPEKKRAYLMKFYLNGIFGIVMEWLDNGCRDEIDVIINIITECVLGDRKTNAFYG